MWVGSIRVAVRPPRRLLAGAAVVASLCLLATGCDSSPYAASVNGQVIKQSSLDRQLGDLSANHAFVTSTVEASAAQGGEGLKVAGQGKGSYSSEWAASVLTANVTAEAVHQHLVAIQRLPDAVQLAAARAVEAARFAVNEQWYGFSPAVRSTIVERDADLAVLLPLDSTITAKNYASIYSGLQSSLFTDVCVRTADVNVTGPGGVDYPASLSKATALGAAIDKAGTTGAGSSSLGGSVTCYSASSFEQQSPGFIATVLKLKDGEAAAPQKKGYGYQVIAVTSRTLIPNGPAFRKAVSVAVQTNTINSTGTTVPAIDAVLAKAHVKIDPQYGTWGRTKAGYTVTPASGPAAHAAEAAGSV